MEYLSYWQRDPAELSSLSLQEHPALIVPQYLASPNTEHNNLNADAIEQWMSEYAAKRGLSAIYKKTEDFVWSPDTALEFACPSSFLTEMFSCVQILDSSISGDTLKCPITALRTGAGECQSVCAVVLFIIIAGWCVCVCVLRTEVRCAGGRHAGDQRLAGSVRIHDLHRGGCAEGAALCQCVLTTTVCFGCRFECSVLQKHGLVLIFMLKGRDGHEREAATRLQDPGPLQRVHEGDGDRLRPVHVRPRRPGPGLAKA